MEVGLSFPGVLAMLVLSLDAAMQLEVALDQIRFVNLGGELLVSKSSRYLGAAYFGANAGLLLVWAVLVVLLAPGKVGSLSGMSIHVFVNLRRCPWAWSGHGMTRTCGDQQLASA